MKAAKTLTRGYLHRRSRQQTSLSAR